METMETMELPYLARALGLAETCPVIGLRKPFNYCHFGEDGMRPFARPNRVRRKKHAVGTLGATGCGIAAGTYW